MSAFAAAAAMVVIGTAYPPPQYDVPYQGTLTIWTAKSVAGVRGVMDLNAIKRAKNESPAGLAFSVRGEYGVWKDKFCDIYVVTDQKVLQAHHGATLDLVLRHELAHCNGWPPDHPNGSTVAWTYKAKPPVLPPSTKYIPLSSAVCVTPARDIEQCSNRGVSLPNVY